MAVPGYLGELETLRIWHDNSGKGSNASWYLDRVDVMDLQKGHLYVILETLNLKSRVRMSLLSPWKILAGDLEDVKQQATGI